jgi:site-specific recombinase XerD
MHPEPLRLLARQVLTVEAQAVEQLKSRIDTGIVDFKFHDLRHSAASYLPMNGAGLVEIAAVLGRKTLPMVKRYAHLFESHTAGVVERMNAAIFRDVAS